jgi:hypothetical protein
MLGCCTCISSAASMGDEGDEGDEEASTSSAAAEHILVVSDGYIRIYRCEQYDNTELLSLALLPVNVRVWMMSDCMPALCCRLPVLGCLLLCPHWCFP